MRHVVKLALAGLLLASGAQAQTVDPASDLGQFRALRGEGMTALQKGDAAAALETFDKARALLPDSPSIALLQAQVYMQQKRSDEAKAVLADYLKRGNVLDLAKNSDFNAIWDSALEDQLQANEAPFGAIRVAAALPDFVIAEALAYEPENEQVVYVSGIRGGKILAEEPGGEREVIKFRPGVAANGLGLHDGKLWASTAQSRQTEGYDASKPVTSKIVAINPADGAVISAVTDSKVEREFGHLLAGKEDLYVIDNNHGEVLRLTGYGAALEVLVPEGYMDAPQGLAESEDGALLIVSDFTSGLYRVDLKAGNMTRLLAPADGNLLGLSSIARYGHDLIAIQNGFKPNRVLRIHMSDDWTQAESVEVLLRSEKLLAQPSQGLVANDFFVFVARSQWGHLDDQGNPRAEKVDPALVGVIKLTP
jgi:tetratricopeptide (TPR) repeat protein